MQTVCHELKMVPLLANSKYVTIYFLSKQQTFLVYRGPS